MGKAQYGIMAFISLTYSLRITLTTLFGEKTIIGVGDSGLDTHSCFFYDEDNPVMFSKTETNNHRKIAK